MEFLIAIVFGLIVGAVVLFVMISAMKTVRPNHTASDYKRPGSLKLRINRDMYLYKKVNKTKRDNN